MRVDRHAQRDELEPIRNIPYPNSWVNANFTPPSMPILLDWSLVIETLIDSHYKEEQLKWSRVYCQSKPILVYQNTITQYFIQQDNDVLLY